MRSFLLGLQLVANAGGRSGIVRLTGICRNLVSNFPVGIQLSGPAGIFFCFDIIASLKRFSERECPRSVGFVGFDMLEG